MNGYKLKTIRLSSMNFLLLPSLDCNIVKTIFTSNITDILWQKSQIIETAFLTNMDLVTNYRRRYGQ